MEFYSSKTQPIIGPVVMLPQKGSVSGGSNRPLNSFAILRDGYSILVDAPFSWTMDGIRALAADGHPPRAMVISHRDIAGSGDAFEAFHEEFGVPIFMHEADQKEDEPSKLDVPLASPVDGEEADLVQEAGIEVMLLPGHSPGSIVLHLKDEEGILLAGDSAVGPGPAQSDQTPRLERPLKADENPAFIATWKKLVENLQISAILPLHGAVYTRANSGEAFDEIVANIWNGEPMDPHPNS